MAEKRSQSLKSMTVTQLRREAVSRGIKGLSKAPREAVYTALRSHCEPMSNLRRCEVYNAQNGSGNHGWQNGKSDCFTPRQQRRIRKGIRKSAGMVA